MPLTAFAEEGDYDLREEVGVRSADLQQTVENKRNPCCPDCAVLLELSRTDTLFGIDREIYLCPKCDENYLKELAVADSPIERAVRCVGCDHMIGRSTAHIFYQSDDLAHFIGDCCWDERLRD